MENPIKLDDLGTPISGNHHFFAKQDGNHEPESLHVLRRWIDHNKMTVH